MSKEVRTSRAVESIRSSRDSESRSNEALMNYNMDYMSPLTVPDCVKKEGYDYVWALKDIRGEDTYDIERLYAKGWTLVPVDRAPEYAIDPLKRNPLATQYFCYKDVMLMERPIVLSERETANFNQRNATKIRSLRGVSDDMNSFASPIRSISSF